MKIVFSCYTHIKSQVGVRRRQPQATPQSWCLRLRPSQPRTRHPSLILPPAAIATTLERKFVICVHNGAAQWLDVRQGMITHAGIEVFGNLHPRDTLLTKATDERKPGTTAYWKMPK